MRFLERYTGVELSRLTSPTRLAIGCCIMLLAPILTLSSFG
jgi:hypothetical protein